MITKFKLFESETSITIEELKNNKYVIFGIENAKKILDYILKNVDKRYTKYISYLKKGINKWKYGPAINQINIQTPADAVDVWYKEIIIFSFGDNKNGPFSELYKVQGYYTDDIDEIDDIITPEEKLFAIIDYNDTFKGELKLINNKLFIDTDELEKKELRLSAKKYNI